MALRFVARSPIDRIASKRTNVDGKRAAKIVPGGCPRPSEPSKIEPERLENRLRGALGRSGACRARPGARRGCAGNAPETLRGCPGRAKSAPRASRDAPGTRSRRPGNAPKTPGDALASPNGSQDVRGSIFERLSRAARLGRSAFRYGFYHTKRRSSVLRYGHVGTAPTHEKRAVSTPENDARDVPGASGNGQDERQNAVGAPTARRTHSF